MINQVRNQAEGSNATVRLSHVELSFTPTELIKSTMTQPVKNQHSNADGGNGSNPPNSPPTNPLQICDYSKCDNGFESTRAHARYCCPTCRVRAWRERQKRQEVASMLENGRYNKSEGKESL